MQSVTVSPKFTFSIPKEIRKSLKIEAGQQFQIITYDGRIELIPIKKASDLRGFLKGMDTTIDREEDRV